MDNITFELGALRSKLAHAGSLRLPDVQTFANLVGVAETTRKASDVYAAWAFLCDTPEGSKVFQDLAAASSEAENLQPTKKAK